MLAIAWPSVGSEWLDQLPTKRLLSGSHVHNVPLEHTK
jgi:hypothetical protein